MLVELGGHDPHANLMLYFGIVLGVVALPGLDMGIVLACTLAGGRRAGFAAIAGIITGGVGHVTLGLIGVSVVLRAVPAAFNAVLLLGAVYVAWIGLAVLRSRPEAPLGSGGVASPVGAFGRGMLTNLLNPKAYLYTLAILPQFVRPEYGPLWPQALAIVAINAATQAGVYGAVAALGDRARTTMAGRPAVGRWIARAVGVLLISTALLAAWEGWRWR